MMTMNFDMTASNLSTASANFSPLPGNAIYDVKFKGLEFSQSKDGKWEFMRIKFSNEMGTHTDTTFGFRPDADKRKKTQYGENPSDYEMFMLKIQHLLHEVAPALEQKMMAGEVVFTPKKGGDSLFKQYVSFLSELLTEFKDTEIKIKLLVNNKGEAEFPRYFASVSKEGKAYRKTNFIGKYLSFTDKENEQIKTASAARPTVMTDTADDLSLGDASASKPAAVDMEDINDIEL